MRLNEVGGTTLNTDNAFYTAWSPGLQKRKELNTVSTALCFLTGDRDSGSGRHLGTSGPAKPYKVPGVAKALKRWHPPVELRKYTGQGYPKADSGVKGQGHRKEAANHTMTSAHSTHK